MILLYNSWEICLKECKSAHNRDTYTPMLIAALFRIARIWNQPTCTSMDEWVKKTQHVLTHTCIYAHIHSIIQS
jgi:hypothetical protein